MADTMVTSRPPTAGAPAGNVIPDVVRRPGRAEVDPARHRRRNRRIEIALGIAVPVLLFVLWQVAAVEGWMDRRFFPAPSDVWSAGYEMIRNGELNEHAIASARRTILGFLIGCGLGVVVAIVLSSVKLVRAAFEPLLYALWTVPKLALLPMLLLIFGLNEKPIIVLIAVNCFFLTCIPTLAAMVAVPLSYRETASSFDATRWQMLRHVTFPAVLPQVFVSLKLCAGASILVLVAVEFVNSQVGMGFIIWNSWQLFLADRMYVGIILIAIAGTIFTMVVSAIGRWLTPWDRPT